MNRNPWPDPSESAGDIRKPIHRLGRGLLLADLDRHEKVRAVTRLGLRLPAPD